MAVAGAAMVSRAVVLAWRTAGVRGTGAHIPRSLQGGFADPMDRREALKILGLREGASRDQVKDKYRKLMRLNHPDQGGSPYVATKVNEAKDFLLGNKRGGRIL
mmetsp:Transcript_13350/g.27118  ORF Transcript_13350/g.27118 Transcript_13350/m.27118 type:complete len:104 (-) Transcript_13350:538-849(-)